MHFNDLHWNLSLIKAWKNSEMKLKPYQYGLIILKWSSYLIKVWKNSGERQTDRRNVGSVELDVSVQLQEGKVVRKIAEVRMNDNLKEHQQC